MSIYETPDRIEPALVDEPSTALADVIADLSGEASVLGKFLHPLTAANLADAVRIMNTYYSNLIEGHNTRPRDIERALSGQMDAEEARRDLQMEAAAHVRVQAAIDRMYLQGTLLPPTSSAFIRWIHEEFYRNASPAMLLLRNETREIVMEPGAWRSQPEHDNAVGRHLPPSSEHVPDFMAYLERRYDLTQLGTAGRILAIPAAHHRFNYIHPFPDGNGRVSRLMSHAMAYQAGIGAHGLWSISRGLARGLESRGEYKRMMDLADTPRQSDLDGRGNLSQRALNEYALWFLKVCLDQVHFMARLFHLEELRQRLRTLVQRSNSLKPQAAALLEEALMRGEFERGEIARITGLPERTARRVLADTMETGLLASSTAKSPVSLRFPESALEELFPRLYPQL